MLVNKNGAGGCMCDSRFRSGTKLGLRVVFKYASTSLIMQ